MCTNGKYAQISILLSCFLISLVSGLLLGDTFNFVHCTCSQVVSVSSWPSCYQCISLVWHAVGDKRVYKLWKLVEMLRRVTETAQRMVETAQRMVETARRMVETARTVVETARKVAKIHKCWSSQHTSMARMSRPYKLLQTCVKTRRSTIKLRRSRCFVSPLGGAPFQRGGDIYWVVRSTIAS